jgi:hypothetical protein
LVPLSLQVSFGLFYMFHVWLFVSMMVSWFRSGAGGYEFITSYLIFCCFLSPVLLLLLLLLLLSTRLVTVLSVSKSSTVAPVPSAAPAPTTQLSLANTLGGARMKKSQGYGAGGGGAGGGGLGPGGSGGGPGGRDGTGAGGYTNLNRGAIAPARILGAALKIVGDYLKQAVSGVEPTFSTLTLPSELVAAFNEIDSYITSDSPFPVTSVSTSVITLTNGIKYDNKTYDSIASTILVNPLREPFHRDALQEVYELYNAMEGLMKREQEIAQKAAAAAASAAASAASAAMGTILSAGAASLLTNAAAGFLQSRVPFGATATKNYVSICICCSLFSLVFPSVVLFFWALRSEMYLLVVYLEY